MRIALLLALTSAAVASAASYMEYSGVKMPQYAGGADYDLGRDPPASQSDDYHGHTPDATASFDYKDEEKPKLKTEKPSKDPDDLNWRKTISRKQRQLERQPPKVEARNKHEHEYDEDVPKLTTNRRHFKHRSRLKSEQESDGDSTSKRQKYNRHRKEDISERKDYLHLDKDYIQEDKNKEFDDDVKYVRDVVSKRHVHRKAREKEIKRQLDQSNDYPEDMEGLVEENDPRDLLPPTRDETRRRLPKTRMRDFAGNNNLEVGPGRTESPPAKPKPVHFKPKSYDDYDDYYDMKRVNNMKYKLPSLLRRTSVSPKTTTSRIPKKKMDFKMWNKLFVSHPTDLPNTQETRLYSEVTKYRTRGHPATRTETSAATRTITFPTEKKHRNRVFVKDDPVDYVESKPIIYTGLPVIPSDTPIIISTTTFQDTTIKTTNFNIFVKAIADKSKTSQKPVYRAEELSVQEKSRLSILKKMQRKEGLKFFSTTKPPVLLQVSSQMPTVVIVEPATPTIEGDTPKPTDSPERLELIKKIMRRKLVANAKSIRDLTDNWDEVVCDYIDTSLLKGSSVRVTPSTLLLLSVFIIKYILLRGLGCSKLSLEVLH